LAKTKLRARDGMIEIRIARERQVSQGLTSRRIEHGTLIAAACHPLAAKVQAQIFRILECRLLHAGPLMALRAHPSSSQLRNKGWVGSRFSPRAISPIKRQRRTISYENSNKFWRSKPCGSASAPVSLDMNERRNQPM